MSDLLGEARKYAVHLEMNDELQAAELVRQLITKVEDRNELRNTLARMQEIILNLPSITTSIQTELLELSQSAFKGSR